MLTTYSFLSQAFKSERLSHAYLVTSSYNAACKEMIYWFSGILFCDNLLHKEETHNCKPCGECRNCRLIQNERHPDLNIICSIDGSIKIAQIRQLKSNACFRPVISNWKLVAILDAHLMTEEAAQSILKILEEPPPYMIFVLTVPHHFTLIPTIVSRCQLIHIDESEIYNNIESSLIQQVLSIVSLLHSELNYEKMIDSFSLLFETPKGEREQFLNLFAKWYWDMARFLTGANILGINQDSSLNKSWLSAIESCSGKLKHMQVFAIYEAILQAVSYYNKNANWRLLLDVLFLKINKIATI